MSYLVAAVTGSTLLGLFNLIVMLGLLRRLRMPAAPPAGGPALLEPGTLVPAFAGSAGPLTGPTLVAFLAPGCQPCETLLPALIDYAGRFPGGRAQVLAVLTMARPEDAADYAERLGPVARVVIEDGRGPASEAFAATDVPVMYLLDTDRRVIAGGGDASFFSRVPSAVVPDGA